MRKQITAWRKAALIICALILVGCGSAPKRGPDLMDFRVRSDFHGAANLYLSPDRKPRYDRNNLHMTLEAAKAFHDAGYWQQSSDAFARAHELMPWKEDTIDTPQEVLTLVATTVTSSAFGPYQGKVHEGGFIDYYRALNQLMTKNENARVSFKRLQERQRNSVVQLGAFARASYGSMREGLAQNQKINAAASTQQIESQLGRGVAKVRAGVMMSEIQIAAGDVMSALFRATSSDPLDNDLNLIQPLLASAAQSAASDEGRELVGKLRTAIHQSQGRLENKVIVVYEDGNGPGFNEYRIDLPMYLYSDKVLYSGIALPEFREGNAAYPYLLVGEQGEKTAVLTDINRMAGLEFEKAYPGIVSKAVISTIIKTAAQYAANKEIDRQVDKQKLDPLAAAFMKIGTAATQAAFTKADTRAWRNLPNTIQIAVVDRPESGRLNIETSNRQPVQSLALEQPGNYLVLIKGAASQMGFAVSLVKL
jgi:hypothetical protein